MQDYTKLYEALNVFRELFVRKYLSINQIAHCRGFLKSMTPKKPNQYTSTEAWQLYQILKPFSDKLKLLNFDFSTVPNVAMKASQPVVSHVNRNKVIGYDGESFIIRFPFDTQLLKDVKEINGAKYDANEKYWRVPITSSDGVKKYSLKHNFEVGDAAQSIITNVNENLEQSYSAEYIELGLPVKLNFYPFQTVGIDYIRKNKRVIVGDQMGLGKMQSVNSTIVTPLGIRRFGDLQIGDIITGRNGKPIEVTGVFPHGKKQLYRVTFSDDFFLDVGLEHLWTVISPQGAEFTLETSDLINPLGTYKHFNKKGNFTREYTKKTYYKEPNGNNRWRIPMVDPVHFNVNENLNIDPYLMGVWLGDGSKTMLTINKKDIDIIDRILYDWKRYDEKDNCFSVKINSETIAELKALNLLYKRSWEKFIPEEYLFTTIENRIKLLNGLMDTDGYAGNKSTEYSTTSKQLADSVCFLVQSLGGIARIKQKQKSYTYKGEKKQGRISYSINIKLNPSFDLFTCKRKKEMYDVCSKYMPERYIKNIEKVGEEESMCISVSAEDRLYVTDHFIVTHNTIQGIGGALITEGFPCLVICPKSLRLNWKDEWQNWTNKRVMVLDKKNAPMVKNLIEQKLIDVVITNYDGVNTHFVTDIRKIEIKEGEKKGTTYDKVYTNGLEKLFNSVILDEAHNCRNKKTIRYKTVKKCFNDKSIRICLTGTPIVKGPQDLGSLLELIGRIDDFGGHYKFVRQYKNMDKRFLNMSKKDEPLSKKDAGLAQTLKELNIKLRSLCFIRREKHQVLKDLPEKFRKVIRTPLDNRKEYDLALNSLEDFLVKNGADAEKIESSLRAEFLVQINTLKQVAAKGKINAVKEFAQEVMENEEKLIIVCWFNDTVQWLRDNLKEYNPVTISGKIDGRNTTDEEIQEAKYMFQNNPDCKIIIITYGKGGEGHTLTAASKVAMIELGWTYKDQGQAEDRAHRIGQKNTVECYYFLGEDTLDEHIYEIIESRRLLEKESTGGSEQIETTFSKLAKVLITKKK